MIFLHIVYLNGGQRFEHPKCGFNAVSKSYTQSQPRNKGLIKLNDCSLSEKKYVYTS